MIENLREGDSVMVWKLDRLARSLKELINLVEIFRVKKVNFTSIKDSIDTSTVQGRLLLNIFGSLAEFERDTIRERTKAGLSAAKARGRMGGKKKGLSPEAKKKAETAVMLYKHKKSAVEIAGIIEVGRATSASKSVGQSCRQLDFIRLIQRFYYSKFGIFLPKFSFPIVV